ncbi:hypothetical protein CYMTET_5055 [Cymbomonas tetramitiformis]|uniref:Uncharacterized protein n=1 Tax=Cymbomonas tetramitiformis TaxID=36881 RepID=A0AAE0LJQ7_9CHLO|nr:hypothetical protein CYMTET_5055 [Cymbomonas tetramitiformis]
MGDNGKEKPPKRKLGDIVDKSNKRGPVESAGVGSSSGGNDLALEFGPNQGNDSDVEITLDTLKQNDNGDPPKGQEISMGHVSELGVTDEDDDSEYFPTDAESMSETETELRNKDYYGVFAEEHTIPEINIFEDPSKAAEYLYENGYALLKFMGEDEVPVALNEFKRTLCEDLPEFKPKNYITNENWEYGCTGFGAVNTASSFHNRFVRAIRLRAHSVVANVLDKYRNLSNHPQTKDVKLQQLFGRMSVRVRSPTSEDWHQDNAETSQYGDGDYREADLSEPLPDVTFGGWIAFNQGEDPKTQTTTQKSVPQSASLYSNSHGHVTPTKAKSQGKNMGFGKLTYDDMTSLIEDRGGPRAVNPTLKTLVHTPPGTIFLMHQTIVHEVRAVKPPEPMFRLYLQFRLTSDDKDLLEFGPNIPPDTVSHAQDGDHRAQNVDDVCENMRVPKLPSDQMPSMYNRKGIDIHAQKPRLLTWFNSYVRDEMRVDENLKTDGSSKELPSNINQDTIHQEGPEKKYYIMPLHAPSLSKIQKDPKYFKMQQLELKWDGMFPKYADIEKKILKPSTDNFNLRPEEIEPVIKSLSDHTDRVETN